MPRCVPARQLLQHRTLLEGDGCGARPRASCGENTTEGLVTWRNGALVTGHWAIHWAIVHGLERPLFPLQGKRRTLARVASTAKWRRRRRWWWWCCTTLCCTLLAGLLHYGSVYFERFKYRENNLLGKEYFFLLLYPSPVNRNKYNIQTSSTAPDGTVIPGIITISHNLIYFLAIDFHNK